MTCHFWPGQRVSIPVGWCRQVCLGYPCQKCLRQAGITTRQKKHRPQMTCAGDYSCANDGIQLPLAKPPDFPARGKILPKIYPTMKWLRTWRYIRSRSCVVSCRFFAHNKSKNYPLWVKCESFLTVVARRRIPLRLMNDSRVCAHQDSGLP